MDIQQDGAVTTNDQPEPLRLLAILAHPDDESLGLGGILAKYAAEGVRTHVITATRGERGWFGPPDENPGLDALGRIRERELHDATRALGVGELTLLDYIDGEVEQADQALLVRRLAGHMRRIRPHVVVTFDHNGIYGHPDHIAVTQAATAATVAACDATFAAEGEYAPYSVPKLYYFAWTQEVREAYERAFGELRMHIDGHDRTAVPWPHWTVSTWIDTAAYWQQVWDAIRCHRSQLPGYQKLLDLPEEYHRALWGRLSFHRVYSLVPTDGHEVDLFDGIRSGEEA
jgi:LmbE family N-acetylglucosaminyl deacetylase